MLCNFNTLAGMDVSLCGRLWIHNSRETCTQFHSIAGIQGPAIIVFSAEWKVLLTKSARCKQL